MKYRNNKHTLKVSYYILLHYNGNSCHVSLYTSHIVCMSIFKNDLFYCKDYYRCHVDKC